MKFFKSIIPVIFIATMISCGDMKDDGNAQAQGDKPKMYTSAADAAAAAKNDMIAAMEQGVNFGVDKEKLRSSTPAAPVMQQMINFDALLKADSAATLESMASGEAVTAVPFIIGPEVVTVVTLRTDNNQYGIGTLGDKQLSTELDMVSRVAGGTANLAIYEVPNLNATIYAAKDATGAMMYYTSYNGMSLRQPMMGSDLVRLLHMDAEGFQKQFGDELKKGKLVR